MADASGTRRETTERTFEITRLLDAPPETVFAAWTDPRQVRRWWGPNGFTTPVAKIDLRPGGTWHYCMRAPDGRDYWCKGVYGEIIPNQRIVSSDFFSDEAGNKVSPTQYGMSAEWPSEMQVTVTFADEAGKTRLNVRQGVSERLARDNGAVQGWTETLDRLAAHLANPALSCPMTTEPGEQHRWLQRLTGAWSFDGEAGGAPDQPAEHFSGTEIVRSLGELWVVAEGEGAMPDGNAMNTVMVLGFDPARDAYVGSFAASMMAYLWIYRGGSRDEAGNRLVLRTEGPDMDSGGTGTAAFEDIITLEDADHRTLTSRMQGSDGQWRQVFSARYSRLPA